MHYLALGEDLLRWESASEKEVDKRKMVLNKLQEKLELPQPAEKSIVQKKLYRCTWKTGDVYAYLLDSNHSIEKGVDGKYLLMYKIGETIWHPGHIVPIVWLKITQGKNLPKNLEEFEQLEYVQVSMTRYEDRFLPFDGKRPLEEQIEERSKVKYECDECGFLPQFRLVLLNTSKRVIPQKLTYVGNYPDVTPPTIEFVPHSELSLQGYNWKLFEDIIIDRYCGYNLGQFEAYSSRRK